MKSFLKGFVLASASALCVFLSCENRNDDTKVSLAAEQLELLLNESEAGDTLRIPSSYKDGQVQFVPVDDWVSGFFAGELWYMYELTGDEKWAESARKFTEVLSPIQYLTWHHDVGFMVYDSYGNGLRLKNIDGYKEVLL